MPHELSRRNQKTAQRYVENGTKDALSALSAATKLASKSSDPAATLASLALFLGMIAIWAQVIATL